jgi:hypothetical protein
LFRNGSGTARPEPPWATRRVRRNAKPLVGTSARVL